MAAPVYKNFTQAAISSTGNNSPADTAIGDLVLCLVWSQGTNLATLTHTQQIGNTMVRSHGHDDGTTDGRLSVSCRVATVAGASASSIDIAGATASQSCCGILTVTGADPNVANWVTNSFTDAAANAPNPPAVTPLTGDWLVLAIGAWHVTTAAATSATVMANYSLRINGPTGTHVTHLAAATRALTGLSAATEDPAIYVDNVTPNGTAAMTIAIPADPGASPSDSFDRTDTVSLGGNWTNLDRTMNIVGNAAQGLQLNWCSARWTASTVAADQYSEITIGALSGGSGIGPMVRMKVDFSYYYLYADGTWIFLQKIVSATAAVTLSTISQACVAGDVLRLEVEGTTLRTYWNTVLKDTKTDSDVSTGQPGILCFASGALTNCAISTWNAGALGVAVGQPMMRRWGGIPHMGGNPTIGRTW